MKRPSPKKKKRNLKLKAEFRSCLTQSGAKPSFDLHASYRQTPLEKVEVKGAICPSRRREKVRPSPSRDFIPGVSWSVKGSESGCVGQRFSPPPPSASMLKVTSTKKNRLTTAWFEQHCRGGVRGEIYTYTSLKHDVLLQLFHPWTVDPKHKHDCQ